MIDPLEGKTATDPKNGAKVIRKNGQWVQLSGPAPGASVPAQVQAADAKALEALSSGAADATEVKRLYDQVSPAVHRLGTGPFRGRFLQAALPDEGGGILDAVGATLIGAPLRAIGAISPQNVDDYQRIKGVQSERIQALQRLQKGVQTEGDAARIALADVSPSKSVNVNDAVIGAGRQKLDRIVGRAGFQAAWRQKYGRLDAVDDHGRGVEAAYQATLPTAAAPAPAANSGWSIVK